MLARSVERVVDSPAGVPWFPPAALPLSEAVAAQLPEPAFRGPRRPIARRTTVITSSTYGCPWPVSMRVGQAAVDVILEQQQADLVGGGRERLDLLEDVEAVRLLVDEALDAREPGPRCAAAG